MAKVNPHKQPVLKVGGKRNSFPLGHSTVYQSPFGALLPVQFFRVPANSYFTMDMENQTIMSPVVRPAFSLMREHFEVFAVPMVQLMQSFDNFITGLSVYDNSAVSYFNTDQNTDKPVTRVKVPTVSGEIIRMALADLNTKVDDYGINKANNATRILDMLGYGNFYSLANEFGGNPHSTATQDDQAFDNSMLRQNLFALLAYQKIYYSHYVNSKYEEIDPRAFNIDDLSNDLTTSDVERFEKMLELHYRYTKKDYFTDVNPYVLPTADSLNFNGLGSTPWSDGSHNSLWQVFGFPTAGKQQGYPAVGISEDYGSSGTNTDGQVVLTSVDSGDPANTSVSLIRFAFAYDKLLRRMRVAGSDFNSQMLAQFGIVPLDQRHGRAKYLGGWTNNLRFSEVTSMADSGSADLGNIGGKMSTFNLNKKRIKYTAKEDSIIMVIYSTSLENQYHSFHQRRENLCQYRFDWYNPAFQDLGPQALYGAEWTNISEQADIEAAGTDPVELQQNFNSTTEKRAILGFVRRWQDYKTRYNEVHGLFQWPYLNPDMCSWVAQHRDYKMKMTNSGAVKDELLPYVPFTRSNLRNSPLALNDILQVSYNGYWNTDPFMCFCYFNARMVANMSDYGEIL